MVTSQARTAWNTFSIRKTSEAINPSGMPNKSNSKFQAVKRGLAPAGLLNLGIRQNFEVIRKLQMNAKRVVPAEKRWFLD